VSSACQWLTDAFETEFAIVVVLDDCRVIRAAQPAVYRLGSDMYAERILMRRRQVTRCVLRGALLPVLVHHRHAVNARPMTRTRARGGSNLDLYRNAITGRYKKRAMRSRAAERHGIVISSRDAWTPANSDLPSNGLAQASWAAG